MSKIEATCPCCGRSKCLVMKTETPVFHIWNNSVVPDLSRSTKKIECVNCKYAYTYENERFAVDMMTGFSHMKDGDLVHIDGAILEYSEDHGDLRYSCTASDARHSIDGKEIHYYGNGRYKFVKGEGNENDPS